MSNDSKRIKVVDTVCEQLEACAVQVTNAVEVARANPGSKAASEHLALLKNNWDHRVGVLRGTLNAITDQERVVAVNRTLRIDY